MAAIFFAMVPGSGEALYKTISFEATVILSSALRICLSQWRLSAFEKFGEENYSNGKSDGFYYNGGSWFRAEYCAYVVGLKHGWKKAKQMMENRIWAEIYLNPK